MKYLRRASVILLIVSVIAFVSFKIYINIVKDTEPPVVTCETEVLEVAVDAPDEELLAGVTAKDSRSGDVTDTLVIESMSDFTEEGTRIITYAAVDESKNVGRCERTLQYKGYKAPTFSLKAPLCFVEGETVDILGRIAAESVLDGDLSSKIKYTMEDTINATEERSYPIEFRVMDSGGKNVYLKTTVEIIGREYAAIDVELDKYLVYVKKGASFDPNKYYKSASHEDVSLTVRSKVNTGKKGVYYVDYIVQSGTLKGKSRLVVVVQ